MLIQIDAGTTSLAAMGNTKLSVLANLREAWNAVPDEVRRERFKVLSENQIQPANKLSRRLKKASLVRKRRALQVLAPTGEAIPRGRQIQMAMTKADS